MSEEKTLRDEFAMAAMRQPKIYHASLDFMAGTDVKEAVAFMFDLHCRTNAQVETVFNGTLIVMADNKMVDKFGLRKGRE